MFTFRPQNRIHSILDSYLQKHPREKNIGVKLSKTIDTHLIVSMFPSSAAVTNAEGSFLDVFKLTLIKSCHF